MGVTAGEKLWLLITWVSLGDVLIFLPSEPQCFLLISLTWQLITLCLETSVVALLLFLLALCSQLTSPLDVQRLVNYVSLFPTDPYKLGLKIFLDRPID